MLAELTAKNVRDHFWRHSIFTFACWE